MTVEALIHLGVNQKVKLTYPLSFLERVPLTRLKLVFVI